MFAVCFVFRSFWIWELKNSGKTWLPFWGAHRMYVYVYKCMYMFICLFIYIKYVCFSKYVGVFVSNGLVQQPSRIVFFFFGGMMEDFRLWDQVNHEKQELGGLPISVGNEIRSLYKPYGFCRMIPSMLGMMGWHINFAGAPARRNWLVPCALSWILHFVVIVSLFSVSYVVYWCE